MDANMTSFSTMASLALDQRPCSLFLYATRSPQKSLLGGGRTRCPAMLQDRVDRQFLRIRTEGMLN
jgi:hypothetical protein